MGIEVQMMDGKQKKDSSVNVSEHNLWKLGEPSLPQTFNLMYCVRLIASVAQSMFLDDGQYRAKHFKVFSSCKSTVEWFVCYKQGYLSLSRVALYVLGKINCKWEGNHLSIYFNFKGNNEIRLSLLMKCIFSYFFLKSRNLETIMSLETSCEWNLCFLNYSISELNVGLLWI